MVVPAGAGLMPAAPPGPVQVVAGGAADSGGEVEQSFDLNDGEGNQPEIGRWRGGWVGWCELRFGAGSGVGGGHGADREGGHDQHDVPHDRRVEADLGLVEAELSLPNS